MTEARRISAAMTAGLCLLLPTRVAHGAGGQQALADAIQVHAGATCLEATAVAEEVASWLGTETADADVWVQVDGSPDDPRVVSFRVGRGDRLLAVRRFSPGPERCEHLQAALALAIALAIKVSLLDEIVGPPEPVAREKPTLETREPWTLSGGALAAFGVFPRVAFGAGVEAQRALPSDLAVRLGVVGLAAWTMNLAGAPGTFDAQIFAGRLDGCVRRDLARRFSAGGCFGLLVGALSSQGHAFPSSRSASTAWTAVASALEMGVGVTDHWSLDTEITLIEPLHRTQVGVLSANGDVVEARDLSSVGATVSVGASYRF
jgi:hypothetical protein